TRYTLAKLQNCPKRWDHFSSSGVFGEDLVGRWLTFDEAIAVNEGLSYARKKAPNNLWADSVGWFDLHAKLG
ncbi:hypothetical protein, partial [Thalassovita autumnalis]|uniref:hypothetical protein n=1 Tax=Thalassovita autumnalis TaxID=2072972 RepID=UPI001A943762